VVISFKYLQYFFIKKKIHIYYFVSYVSFLIYRIGTLPCIFSLYTLKHKFYVIVELISRAKALLYYNVYSFYFLFNSHIRVCYLSLFFLPGSIKRFNVIRAPFVFKKSKEHFEFKNMVIVLRFKFYDKSFLFNIFLQKVINFVIRNKVYHTVKAIYFEYK